MGIKVEYYFHQQWKYCLFWNKGKTRNINAHVNILNLTFPSLILTT